MAELRSAWAVAELRSAWTAAINPGLEPEPGPEPELWARGPLVCEPTGSVDPTLGRRLLRLFIELNRLGTAVIIATHDITLMDQYEARRMVLHQGRLHIYE